MSWSGSVLQNSLQLSSKKSGPPFFKAPGLGPKEVVKHREDTFGHFSAITSANCPESFDNLTRDGPKENLASMCWCQAFFPVNRAVLTALDPLCVCVGG